MKKNIKNQDIDILFLISVLLKKKYLIFSITIIFFSLSFLFNYQEYKYQGSVSIKFDKINTYKIAKYFKYPTRDLDLSDVKKNLFLNHLLDNQNIENSINSINPNYKISKKADQIINYEVGDYYKYTFINISYDMFFGSINKNEYQEFIVKHLENSIKLSNEGFELEYNYFINSNVEIKKENLEGKLKSYNKNLSFLKKEMDILRKEITQNQEESLSFKLSERETKLKNDIFDLEYLIFQLQKELDQFIINSKDFLFSNIVKQPDYSIDSISVKEKIKKITFQLPATIGGFLFALIISSIFVYFRIFENVK